MSGSIKWTGFLAVSVNERNLRDCPDRPHLWKTAARLSVNKPALGSNEVAVRVSVELPISLFQRPSLEARIVVPSHSVSPLQIDMEVIDNIQQLIASQTGFDVKLIPTES